MLENIFSLLLFCYIFSFKCTVFGWKKIIIIKNCIFSHGINFIDWIFVFCLIWSIWTQLNRTDLKPNIEKFKCSRFWCKLQEFYGYISLFELQNRRNSKAKKCKQMPKFVHFFTIFQKIPAVSYVFKQFKYFNLQISNTEYAWCSKIGFFSFAMFETTRYHSHNERIHWALEV